MSFIAPIPRTIYIHTHSTREISKTPKTTSLTLLLICRQSSPWPPISISRPRHGNLWRSAVWSSSVQDHTPASWSPLLRLSTTSGYVEFASWMGGMDMRRIRKQPANNDEIGARRRSFHSRREDCPSPRPRLVSRYSHSLRHPQASSRRRYWPRPQALGEGGNRQQVRLQQLGQEECSG